MGQDWYLPNWDLNFNWKLVFGNSVFENLHIYISSCLCAFVVPTRLLFLRIDLRILPLLVHAVQEPV